MKRARVLGIFALCAILATALIMGTVGCGNTAGDNEIPNDKKTPVTTPNCGRDFVIPEPAELDGVKFVNDNESTEFWRSSTRENEYENHYQKAQAFMNEKVADLNQAIAGQTDIALFQEINDALQKMNQGNNIRDNINGNYNAMATVFADFEKNQLKNYSDENYYAYQASYIKLAHNAYNQALGFCKNQTSISFPGNSEMKNDPTSFFGIKLIKANLSYDELTVDTAKTYMNNTIDYIANNNGISSDVLKKFVELALYNESLYGLNDLAKYANVNAVLNNTPRTAVAFTTAIDQAKLQMQTRNIEDTSMTL